MQREIKRLKKFGYQHIDTATTIHEAKAKLANEHFDVIVADMRMDKDDGSEVKDESGGFTILDEIQKNNITSVIIILTANDTFEDCRKALKHNSFCWDYIPKTIKDNKSGLEELHDSIQAALAHWNNHKDKEWVAENKASLLEEYADKYIAILNNLVIASANTEEELKQQITEHKLPLLLPFIMNMKDYTVATVMELLQQEESNTLEFKGSFYYDSNEENKKNIGLRFNNLKTITAFLNSDGGTLLIGITDDKGIYGVENDFLVSSKKQNQDGFELMLNDMISNYIGAEFFKFIN